jgi:hypothetical protein
MQSAHLNVGTSKAGVKVVPPPRVFFFFAKSAEVLEKKTVEILVGARRIPGFFWDSELDKQFGADVEKAG